MKRAATALGRLAAVWQGMGGLRAVAERPRPVDFGPANQPRDPATYRGARRNRQFGRKPVGNTKPHERRAIWGVES